MGGFPDLQSSDDSLVVMKTFVHILRKMTTTTTPRNIPFTSRTVHSREEWSLVSREAHWLSVGVLLMNMAGTAARIRTGTEERVHEEQQAEGEG